VHVIIFPLASIDITIFEMFHAMTFHFSVLIFALVFGSIGPKHQSTSMNLILKEITLINFTSFVKIIFSFSMELSVNEISFIKISVKFEFACASFKSIDKVTLVDNFVVIPLFGTFTVICVFEPFTFVHGPFGIYENTLAASHAVFPLALIYIAITVGHSSDSIKLTIFRHSLIL